MALKRTPTFEPADFSEWNYNNKPILNHIDEIIETRMRSIFEQVMDDANISFPIMWSPDGDGAGGPPVTDPMTVHLNINVTGGEFSTWTFSLRDEVRSFLHDVAGPDRDYQQLPDNEKAVIEKLRQGFVELIEMIDSVRARQDA